MADGGSNTIAASELRNFIERIERLDEERRGILADQKDVYAEAKATGFDTKTMRKMVALRRLESNTREEQRSLEETYMQALGLL